MKQFTVQINGKNQKIKTIMKAIKILCHSGFYLASFFGSALFILTTPFALLSSLKICSYVAYIWARYVLWCARVFLGISACIEGQHYLTQGPMIVASKHQSMWETLMLYTLLDNPVFFLKRQLLFIPLIGAFLARLKMIVVRRGKKKSGQKHAYFLQQAQGAVRDGRAIVIFPEGTRTIPGAFKRYHKGVYVLYQGLDLPVIPVALNAGIFWARRTFFKSAGVITLRFLPPIQPGIGQEAFMARLFEQIENHSYQLCFGHNRPSNKDSLNKKF